jgi:hypothetical protein
VFRSKSNTEKALDRAREQLLQASELSSSTAGQVREKVGPAVAQAAQAALAAKDWTQPHVEAARDWAKPHVEHGIEMAAPKVETAVQSLAPKVDTARDKIVDDVLPRITAALAAAAAASAAARDEAVAAGHEAAVRGSGAKSVLVGEAVAKHKRHLGKGGKLALVAGVLAALGAAAAYFVKRSAPQDDPWAVPLQDPYVPPAGVDSTPAATLEDAAAGVTEADSTQLLDGSGEVSGTGQEDGERREPGQPA